MSIHLIVTVLCFMFVFMVPRAACWTSSNSLHCKVNYFRRNNENAISKIYMADTARIAENKLFGSRRLYRWMHKAPTLDPKKYDDEARGIELIKLITIASLHSDVTAESTRASAQDIARGNPRYQWNVVTDFFCHVM